MNKHTSFLIRLSAFAASAAALPARAAATLPLPLRTVQPELMAALLVSLAALACAVILQRRSRSEQERSRSLEQQLQAERSAHTDVEDALAGSHEVLCRLVRQQETVREAERCRIARDLHDELGHRLLSLRVELALQQAAARGTSAAVYDKLSIAIASLDTAIRSVRAIVAGLRPIAPGVSLRESLERHLADFTRLHGLDYRFDAGRDPASRHDRELDTVLFRVLQESLANVVRHARASLVCVTLVESAGEAVLRIEDDGIGPAEAAETAGADGCGIAGMRERAQAYGGTLSFSQGRSGGTLVCVRLPLRQSAVTA